MNPPPGKLTLEQETWMLKHIRPCPEVFVVAWVGTSYKSWKVVGMFSKEAYSQIKDVEALVHQEAPSATLVRVFVT